MRTLVHEESIGCIALRVYLHPEDTPIKGNVLDSGDEVRNAKAEKRIIDALNRGNRWAWCTVEVVATYKDIEVNDFLGTCSYKNLKDFLKCSNFKAMKVVTIEGLYKQLKEYRIGDALKECREFLKPKKQRGKCEKQ